jgi:hypothetical protein
MKKLAYLLAVICIPFIFLPSCKEDSTPPSVTVTGDAHVITQRGVPYSDAGATATDDKDKSVYVMSDYSAVNPKNPNTDIAGDYLITYTAQDRAGNISTAIRRVSVTYTMWDLNHYYNVTDICLSDTNLNVNYVSNVSIDTNYIYRTFFTNMSNFFSGLTYMDPVGTTITIPKQKPDGIASSFEIEGSGTVSDSANVKYVMVINYTIRDTTNTLPLQTRRATFISQ